MKTFILDHLNTLPLAKHNLSVSETLVKANCYSNQHFILDYSQMPHDPWDEESDTAFEQWLKELGHCLNRLGRGIAALPYWELVHQDEHNWHTIYRNLDSGEILTKELLIITRTDLSVAIVHTTVGL